MEWENRASELKSEKGLLWLEFDNKEQVLFVYHLHILVSRNPKKKDFLKKEGLFMLPNLLCCIYQ